MATGAWLSLRRGLVGAVGVVTGLAATVALPEDRSQCASVPRAADKTPSETPSEQDVLAFMCWLRNRGADVEGVQLKQSDRVRQPKRAGGLWWRYGLCAPACMPRSPLPALTSSLSYYMQDSGRLGLFATEEGAMRAGRGWASALAMLATPWRRNAPITLASFPLPSALTAASLSGAEAVALGTGAPLGAGPEAAAQLAELQQLGLADERSVVMLHLAVQRAAWRADLAPALGPWLALLPQSFSTLLYFGEEDLGWLRGTTLHAAAM